MKQLFIQPLTEWRSSSANPGSLNQLGDIIEYNNKKYMYVQYKAESVAAITPQAGTYVVRDGANAYIVTPDVSVGGTCPGGVLCSTPTDLYYGWIQIKGVATLAHALVSGANGNALTPSTTTDGSLKVAGALTDAQAARCIDATNKIVELI